MSQLKEIHLFTVMAIDPGVGGAIATYRLGKVKVQHMPKEQDGIAPIIRELTEAAKFDGRPLVAVMERVNGFMGKALPGSRMFTMGENYGFMKGALAASSVPLTLVQPTKWQADLGLKKEKNTDRPAWKRQLCFEAKAMYPNVNITLQDADAILLLHWARLNLNIF